MLPPGWRLKNWKNYFMGHFMYLVLWRISPWSTFLTEPRAQSGRHKRERRPIVCWLMINRAARECWINEISFTNIEHKAWLETPQPPVGDSHSGRQGDKEREKNVFRKYGCAHSTFSLFFIEAVFSKLTNILAKVVSHLPAAARWASIHCHHIPPFIW